MKVMYYPGCTLKTRAKSLDATTRASLSALGVETVEPARWTCCGVVPALADDDVIRFLGPVRNLIRMKNQGERKVITSCAMCYNSLARANLLMRNGDERKQTIDLYFEEEKGYHGEVEVVHLLQFLRDEIGMDAIRERVRAPLKDMPVAAYYGCTLLRPTDLAVDSPAHPTVLQDLLECVGAKPVDFPAQSQCCSSFQVASHPDAAIEVASGITAAAAAAGAEMIVTSCPLCDYNLKAAQGRGSTEQPRSEGGPKVAYFTELLSLAFGLGT
jgi:heterodisulfide reductase subunit B2